MGRPDSATATANAPKNSSKRESSWLKKWLLRSIFLGIIFAVYSWLDSIKDRFYVFTPEYLHELSQAAISAAPSPSDTDFMVSYIVSNLSATYPSSVIALNTNTSEWVLNNAGGAMGAMYIIHASITEYLIVFGTPLGTEGHTGLHTADDYFNILVGEQWAFSPPKLEMERYGPGSVHHLQRGQVKQYKMHEGCFALEYARGWIPLMLPFGLMDVLTSTLDYWSLYHTVRVTGREMLRNLLLGKI
ncbi:C-8 sterol isomerase [Laetiporus sulphureus 93-53]|uniref:C-8 sterol isomerase n=1 Tax=Laetiporus sulphureus 93-53 TaxID=1314785 RepID=A0A165B8N0_9APHY|nr:C-8 sterol isomerase [Laetiporus sulphureus 93-53]KZT00498.1 C-8 sterol isomerase [Laetiporus sulphureus 93-53]